MVNLRKIWPLTSSFLKIPVHMSITKQHKNSRLCSIKWNGVGGIMARQVSEFGNHGNEQTVGGLFKKWRSKFARNLISEPQESIEHILAYCLGTDRISDVYKFKNKSLSKVEVKLIESLCLRRMKRIPIQYVLGEWSFRFLNLKMAPPVFIPRPETEQLVDLVLAEIDRKNCLHVLDLCCGSGAIALCLLQERPEIKATAVDQSLEACQLTKENAQKNNGLNKRIRIIQSQLDRLNLCEKFDIIVSNPPYILSEDLVSLQAEIAYEDVRALDGGREGLDVIKTILEISSECLNEKGKLFLEVEPRHPPLLQAYLLQNNALGLVYVATHKDFCAKDRFVEIMKA